MKAYPADEVADRAAEERSEDDGMPEHAAKARDPVRWAADRRARTSRRIPQNTPGRPGLLGLAVMSCALLAGLALARGTVHRIWHQASVARLSR
jgi:hypothetical protein